MYGDSFLSEAERGRRPCRRPPKITVVYGVFGCYHFFSFFGVCG